MSDTVTVDQLAVRRILGIRVQDLMSDALIPAAHIQDYVNRGLGGDLNRDDGGIDPDKLKDTATALGRTVNALKLVHHALVETQKQLDCDHDWVENRFSIRVGTFTCRKCDLSIESRYAVGNVSR